MEAQVGLEWSTSSIISEEKKKEEERVQRKEHIEERKWGDRLSK